MACVVYDSRYNMGLLGVERWHPFDVRKYERAWALIEEEIVGAREKFLVGVDRACTREELLWVHTREYLDRLKSPSYLSKVFEVLGQGSVPVLLIDRGILKPMRWASRGTVIATRESLKQGVAINLGGGFHHAKPGAGEGFLRLLRHRFRSAANARGEVHQGLAPGCLHRSGCASGKRSVSPVSERSSGEDFRSVQR